MQLPFPAQNDPATDEDLESLEEVTGQPLPAIYRALLTYSNGGEWPIDVSPYTFVMFDVDTVIGNLTGTDFAEVYPNCLPIGGDGMSEYIALAYETEDPEEEPKVVAIDATEDDPAKALYPMTNSLAEFVRHIGKELEE